MLGGAILVLLVAVGKSVTARCAAGFSGKVMEVRIVLGALSQERRSGTNRQ